jgi:hypothetical protein
LPVSSEWQVAKAAEPRDCAISARTRNCRLPLPDARLRAAVAR